MKNNVDYRYEFSDLNSMHFRTEILKGKYKGLVLEFGDTNLMVGNGGGDLVFNYTLYTIPEKFNGETLIGDEKFEKFLSDVLVSLILHRNNDPKYPESLQKALGKMGSYECSIKIDPKFYVKKQETTHN